LKSKKKIEEKREENRK